MKDRGHPVTVCDEIACELRDLAAWLSNGELDPERFRQAVLALEEKKVTRYGFTLTGTNEAGITSFRLLFADDGELCATVTADSQTGELTTEFADDCDGRG